MGDPILRCAPQTNLDPNQRIALAGKEVLSTYYDLFLERESGTLSGKEIEDLHKMRTTTRRMRSLLKSMADIYGLERVVSLRGDLRRVASHLGELRDIDTFVQFLQGCSSQLAKSVQPAVQHLIGERLAVREEERINLNEKLALKWYLKFKKTFETFIREHSETDLRSPIVRIALPPLIEKALFSVIAQRDRVFEASAEELHRLRIKLKRLRYLCEAFGTCYKNSIHEMLNTFIELQDILGAMQDNHRDILFLKESRKSILSGSGKSKGKSSLDELIDHFEKNIEKERARFYAKWRPFALKENEIRMMYLIRNGIV